MTLLENVESVHRELEGRLGEVPELSLIVSRLRELRNALASDLPMSSNPLSGVVRAFLDCTTDWGDPLVEKLGAIEEAVDAMLG